MTFKIEVSHSVSFPSDGEYTPVICAWADESGVGYSFSRGDYTMNLTEREWLSFVEFLLDSTELVGKDEIHIT